jgi:putative membrane protein
MMDWTMGGGWGAGMMLVMGLLWLLVLAALVAGIVWLARVVWDRSGSDGRDRGRPGGDTPLDILRRRYAAGEISHDEFERMKRELSET